MKDRIAVLPVDSQSYPNLALMKISNYYKKQGAIVSFYNTFENFDLLYMSKIFTFTKDYEYFINNCNEVYRGGTGYDATKKLPVEIDSLQPDYSLYKNFDQKTALGFLTRGCINKCNWCIVPKKEGLLHKYMDIEEIAIEKRNKVILMDNNILAIDYGFEQLEKIIKLKLKVDFNQGLDARKIDFETAKILAKIKWLKYIRIACDTSNMVDICLKAIQNLRNANYNGEIFIYTLINNNIIESYERINIFRNLKKITPFAQPYRDFSKNKEPPQWQLDLARWVNRKEIFNKIDFKDYIPRKYFKCKKYFEE